jgi:hypothetical protein
MQKYSMVGERVAPTGMHGKKRTVSTQAVYSDPRPRFKGVAQVMRFYRARRRDRKLLSNQRHPYGSC